MVKEEKFDLKKRIQDLEKEREHSTKLYGQYTQAAEEQKQKIIFLNGAITELKNVKLN